MATNQPINSAPFIQALRTVIKSLPFSDEDREVLLAAVEQRARCVHNAREAADARRRHALKPVRRISTPETRAREAAYMRAYRARKRAAKTIDA